MKKTIKAGDLRIIAEDLVTNWQACKDQINVGVITLYNLIGLKKTCEREYMVIQEAIMTFAESLGGEPTEQGGIKVPPENVEEMNKKISELFNQDIEIEYKEIQISPKDEIPAQLLDSIFDFCTIKEE